MGKQNRKIGQAVRKHVNISYRVFFNRLCDLPLKERLITCRRILFKQTFPNTEAK